MYKSKAIVGLISIYQSHCNIKSHDHAVANQLGLSRFNSICPPGMDQIFDIPCFDCTRVSCVDKLSRTAKGRNRFRKNSRADYYEIYSIECRYGIS